MSALYLTLDTHVRYLINNDKGTDIGFSVLAQLILKQECDMKGHDPRIHHTGSSKLGLQTYKNILGLYAQVNLGTIDTTR